MQGLRRTNKVVGLDLGAGAVKLVELAGGMMRSSAFALIPQEEASGTTARAGAIRSALREASPHAVQAVVGLDAGEAIMHRFALPMGLPDAEIEEQARMHAGQAAPYPPDDVRYDYVAESQAGLNVNYRMAIARATAVELLYSLVEDAGMKVAAVDVTACALQRSLQLPSAQSGPLLVLDGGHRQTRLTMYAGGDIEFQHSQPFGCAELAQRLQEAYGLSSKDTVKAIEECSRPGGAASRIRQAFLGDFARHAKRAMQLCLASRREGAGPERMLVWGGAALLHGVCRVLQESLGLPVSLAGPGPALRGSEKPPAYSPVLPGAYSLALNDHA